MRRSLGAGLLCAVALVGGCLSLDPFALTREAMTTHEASCSDPVYGQVAEHCCQEHDEAYARGGTEADRAHADHKMALCSLEAEVPNDVVEARFWVLRHSLIAWTRFNHEEPDDNGRTVPEDETEGALQNVYE